jgi:hypothetical protein
VETVVVPSRCPKRGSRTERDTSPQFELRLTSQRNSLPSPFLTPLLPPSSSSPCSPVRSLLLPGLLPPAPSCAPRRTSTSAGKSPPSCPDRGTPSTVAHLSPSCRSFATETDLPVMASLFSISEEEEMLRDAVRKFANEVVAPKVMEMDEAEHMDPTIVKGLFDQGVSLHCASRRDGSGH